MAEQQPSSENRPRRQGGGNRRPQNNRRRDGDDRPRTEHETYRRGGEATNYTPPSEQRKTFGGGEYERVYRDKPVPKKPLGQRILGILSFGLLGKDKPAPSKTQGSAPRGRDSDRGNGPSRRGDRPDRRQEPRGERSQQPRRSDQESGPRRSQPPRERSETSTRPIDLEAITTPRLHVGNLSYDTVESDLFELFNGIGKVVNSEIVTHSRTQRSKGFGFVQFATLDEAKRAASELHGKPFMGRVLILGPAKGARPERDERDDDDEPSPAPLQMD